MPVPDDSVGRRQKPSRHQAGVMVVEFALIALLFFAFLFAVIDLARLMFLYNTLQEVTRRAADTASMSDPGDAAAMNRARQQAIFRNSSGGLILMQELTDNSVRIDYMSVSRDSVATYALQEGSAPSSPAENRHNCAVDPYAANCVRLVRVRICDAQVTSSCEPMKFRSMVSFFAVQIPLPLATTIAKTQSFGLEPR